MRKYYLSLIESYRPLREAPELELIFRINCLHAESNRRPQDAGVPMADIREAVVIVRELKRKLGRLGVFYVGGKK